MGETTFERPKVPMTVEWTIQHRTTKRYVAASPSVCAEQHTRGLPETAVASEAAHWANAQAAEQERLAIEDFADAFEVVPVEIEMFADTPSEVALTRMRVIEQQRDRRARHERMGG